MAIKGKGRTRARQPVRAPRRGPVAVPVPFARRRGVQVVAAFMAGLLVFWGGIWLTNGLREQQRTDQDRKLQLARRQAGAAWESLVETQVKKIGTMTPPSPPVVLPQIRSLITGLAKKTPTDAVPTLQAAAADAKQAADTVGAFDVTTELKDKGFDPSGVIRFLSAKDELITALSLYREAALVGVVAAGLEGRERTAALDRAESLLSLADAAVARFQIHQSEALAAAGIAPQQPSLPGA